MKELTTALANCCSCGEEQNEDKMHVQARSTDLMCMACYLDKNPNSDEELALLRPDGKHPWYNGRYCCNGQFLKRIDI